MDEEEEQHVRANWREIIEGVEVNPYEVRVLVLNYLLHHCYVDTAQAFIDACNLHEEGKRLRVAVQQRKGSRPFPPSMHRV
jgi:hypothetical protein